MNKEQRRPNIIFFFTDQQRWDTCGCYGQKLDTTPNLDKMAKEGVLFENAFTCQPVCGPARACLQTGKFASETGNHTNHTMLPPNEDTIAKILNRHGYDSAYIGKWHLASFGKIGGPDDFRVRPVPIDRRGGYLDYWFASDVLEFTSHSYDGYMFDSDGNVFSRRADIELMLKLIELWSISNPENRKTRFSYFYHISSHITKTITTVMRDQKAQKNASKILKFQATCSERKVIGGKITRII